jgi:hypothetical protein
MPAMQSLWYTSLLIAAGCGAIGAEALRNRRIRRFGDPLLLSVDRRLAPRIAAAVLFLCSVAAIGAILSGSGQVLHSPTQLQLAFLIDAGVVDPIMTERGIVTDSLREIASAFRSSYVSVYRAGPSMEEVAPGTLDVEGALMLVDRLAAAEGESGEGLSGDAAALLDKGAGLVAIFTRMPREQVEGLWQNGSAGAPLIARLEDGPVVEFGARNERGRWVWSANPAIATDIAGRRHAGAAPFEGWLVAIQSAQGLAGIAVLLLGVETGIELARGKRAQTR